MHLFPPIVLLAQAVSADDIAREATRLQRNYQFLSYGLIVAWLVLVVYVLMMAARERRLRREIDGLKLMLEERQKR